MRALILIVIAVAVTACAQLPSLPLVTHHASPKRADKVVHTSAQWKRLLTPAQFSVLRGEGTEAAFSGAYWNNHQQGVYYCAACGNPVFRSSDKFDSGTGWPSYVRPYDDKSVWIREDDSLGMQRIEVMCAKCDSHLGHVFDDGPTDRGGLRYCINSVSLTFKKKS